MRNHLRYRGVLVLASFMFCSWVAAGPAVAAKTSGSAAKRLGSGTTSAKSGSTNSARAGAQGTAQKSSTPNAASSQTARGSFLRRFDANGDGVLDQSEMAAAENTLLQMFQQAQSNSRGAGQLVSASGANGVQGTSTGGTAAGGCTGDGTDTGTTTTGTTTSATRSSTNALRGSAGQRAGSASLGGAGRAMAGARGLTGGPAGGRRGR